MNGSSTNSENSQNAGGFFRKANQVGQLCLNFENPLVVHHLDCDGLTSGALAKQAFLNSGRDAPTLMLKKLDDDSAKLIPKENDLIFTDLGAGQMELVESLPNPNKAILDHHPPTIPDSPVPRINCHDFGFDGSVDACSASTCYFSFRHVNVSALLGLTGCVGDLQDKNGLHGLNLVLLNEGMEKGEILRTKDLRIFGKVSRPLVSFLTYCTEPFLPGLTGNDRACAVFLKNLGIPTRKNGKTLAYYDLSVFERKALSAALIEYGKKKSVDENLLRDMIGDVYVFPKEPDGSERKEAYEFSTLLNACGRGDRPDIGIGACLNDPVSVQEARNLLQEHRFRVREGIGFARKNASDAGPFYLVDGRGVIGDTVIGVVCGAYFTSGLVERNKPIIGLSVDENNAVKASGRGTKSLVEKGLDLGEVMKKAAEKVGGFGGGHNVAAGASFPNTPENIHAFLIMAKQVVEVQLQLR